jgi:hypothetical protein
MDLFAAPSPEVKADKNNRNLFSNFRFSIPAEEVLSKKISENPLYPFHRKSSSGDQLEFVVFYSIFYFAFAFFATALTVFTVLTARGALYTVSLTLSTHLII